MQSQSNSTNYVENRGRVGRQSGDSVKVSDFIYIYTMKRPKVWIIGILGEHYSKVIENVFNKIIEKSFPT